MSVDKNPAIHFGSWPPIFALCELIVNGYQDLAFWYRQAGKPPCYTDLNVMVH